MKNIAALSGLLLIALVSCGSSDVSTVPQLTSVMPDTSLQTTATAVPVANAQALVLTAGLREGSITAASVDQTKLSSVLVNDLDNNPFYYLTLSGKGSTPDFWTNLAAVSGNYKIYGTGASQDRNLYAFEFGKAFGDKLLALHNRIDFKQFVSPQGSIIYMQDKSGAFWEVSNGQRVSPETLKTATTLYGQLKADYFAHPNDVTVMRTAWKTVADTMATASSTLSSQSIKAVDQSGELNIGGIVNSFSMPGVLYAQSAANDPASWGLFGWINSRAGIAGTNYDGPTAMRMGDNIETAVPEWTSRFNSDYGNQQNADSYPYYQTLPAGKQWGIRFFNPLIGGFVSGRAASLVGCVPTAFLRIIKLNSLYGGYKDNFSTALNTKYSTGNVTNNISSMLYAMAAPEQSDSIPAGYVEPHITRLFGGGAVGSGVVTDPYGVGADPYGFAAGYPAAISEILGSQFYMVGGMRGSFAGLGLRQFPPTTDFGQFSYIVRDTVRQVINDDNNAVTYSYTPVSGLFTTSGHNAVAYAYRVYEHIGYSDVFVYQDTAGRMEGVGGDTGWINITNRWTSTQGAAGVRYRAPVTATPPSPTPTPPPECRRGVC